MRHDCRTQGHIMVEDDWECLACERILELGDVIGIRVTEHRRQLGELLNPADRASDWPAMGIDPA